MRTVIAYFNRRDVLVVIKHLAERSIWFEFTPLPDDQYAVKVKEEQTELLRRLVNASQLWVDHARKADEK